MTLNSDEGLLIDRFMAHAKAKGMSELDLGIIEVAVKTFLSWSKSDGYQMQRYEIDEDWVQQEQQYRTITEDMKKKGITIDMGVIANA